MWQFLRNFNLDYCPLYDDGYTSLGKTTDTHPNPALLVEPVVTTSASATRATATTTATATAKTYLPAYMLGDWSLERAGRGTDKVKKLPPSSSGPPPQGCDLKDKPQSMD